MGIFLCRCKDCLRFGWFWFLLFRSKENDTLQCHNCKVLRLKIKELEKQVKELQNSSNYSRLDIPTTNIPWNFESYKERIPYFPIKICFPHNECFPDFMNELKNVLPSNCTVEVLLTQPQTPHKEKALLLYCIAISHTYQEFQNQQIVRNVSDHYDLALVCFIEFLNDPDTRPPHQPSKVEGIPTIRIACTQYPRDGIQVTTFTRHKFNTNSFNTICEKVFKADNEKM